MKCSSKVTYSILAVLVIVTIIYRYPLSSGHELGSDTTFIHTLTNSLVSQQRASWILSPLSYFGLYALSYPSADPFLLASLATVADIPIEAAILIVGFAFAVVGCLAAFAAARLVKDDIRFAILVAILFSIAPYYIKETTWMGSSRGFVSSLVPALFLVLLLHMRTHNPSFLCFAVLLVVLMSALHRMGVLTALVLIAYLFALPFHRLTQQARFALARHEAPFRIAGTGSAVAGFLVLLGVQFIYPGIVGSDAIQQYENGALFTGTSFPVLLANMAVSLVGKVGLLLPLFAVGIIEYVWKRPKEARDKFLLVTVFVLIPLLSLRDYVADFLVFAFIVLIAFALVSRPPRIPTRKAAALAVVGVLTIGSMGFAWVMKDYWRNRYYTDGPITDDMYATAVYVEWRTTGSVVSNEGMSAGRVAAISNRPVLPLGGASNHWFGPQQVTFGFQDPNKVGVKPVPILDLTFQTDWIFVPVNVRNAKDDYETIFYNGYGSSSSERVLAMYQIHYLMMMNSMPSEFQSYIWRQSPFIVQVQQQAYRTYDSGYNSLWYLG